VKCANDDCVYTCRSGFHDCQGSCKDDKSVQSCGSSCSACTVPPGGSATCKNGQCDFECPGGRKCGNGCVAQNQPCNGACPGGTRLCNGACVTGNCCGDGDCGTCKTCQNNQCRDVQDGQQAPGCNGASGCSNRTERDADTCQGGSCRKGNSKSCAPYDCNGSNCGTTCPNGTTLINGSCQACGGNGQPCCGNSCNSGSCRSGRCCSGDQVGTGSGCGCPSNLPKSCGGTKCVANSDCCESCGGCSVCSGGSCKAQNSKCSETEVCQGTKCVQCGDNKQPCCDKTRNEECFNVYRCWDGKTCSCKPDKTCAANECGDLDDGCGGIKRCPKATCSCVNGDKDTRNNCTGGVTGCPANPSGGPACVAGKCVANGYSECN
jgi:hypothetical protein